MTQRVKIRHILNRFFGGLMNLNIKKELFFERGGLLDKILDSTFDRALIINKHKEIIFFSESSRRYVLDSNQRYVGRKLDEIVQNTGFDEVLRTGESDKGIIEQLDGELAIASHIPVFDNDELLGAIGMVYFSNLKEVNALIAKLPANIKGNSGDVYHKISRQTSAYTFKDYVGKAPIVLEMIEKTKRAALSNLPILFIGETGTGKEILANAAHSHNKETFSNPFVKINCSAIPDDLMEAELFGYEKGAFTGATSLKKGKFEVAYKGSILLDEIGDMPYNMQAKLLRVLEEKEFERVGGNILIPAQTRIIASTNANLERLSFEKKFRADLYYRLNALEIHVPPLRAHPSDIPLLIEYFMTKNDAKIKFSEAAIKAMVAYSWPGNVRQLRNLINHFSVLNEGETIMQSDVEAILQPAETKENHTIENTANPYVNKTFDVIEKEAIASVLLACDGNRSLAASKLAISRSTLIRKIKQYHL